MHMVSCVTNILTRDIGDKSCTTGAAKTPSRGKRRLDVNRAPAQRSSGDLKRITLARYRNTGHSRVTRAPEIANTQLQYRLQYTLKNTEWERFY